MPSISALKDRGRQISKFQVSMFYKVCSRDSQGCTVRPYLNFFKFLLANMELDAGRLDT